MYKVIFQYHYNSPDLPEEDHYSSEWQECKIGHFSSEEAAVNGIAEKYNNICEFDRTCIDGIYQGFTEWGKYEFRIEKV
jgi:hypothetical protein